MDIIFWLAVFVVMLIVEFMTMGLTTIWFAAGSLISFVVALLGGPMWLQALVFFAVSIVLLIFTRPLVTKYQKKNVVKTNIDSLIGKEAKVIEEIDNNEAKGRAMIEGQEWMARSSSNEIIAANTMVIVERIEGAKLIVK
ncbi:MAG: NfeD family protein [Lachnospiraceae bacterium]|nr:NfeD family protein [Lachnospiraceae bacterium]